MSIMKYQYKLASVGLLAFSAAGLLVPSLANASLVSGDAAISINNPVLATTTTSSFYPAGITVSGYFDSTKNNTTIDLGAIPTSAISATSNNQNLAFPVFGSTASSSNASRFPQATTMDTSNTSTGQIGLSGALKATNPGLTNYQTFQDFTLQKVGGTWNLVTHDGLGANTLFQLTNVSEGIGANGLSLSGDLIFPSNANLIGLSWGTFLGVTNTSALVGHLNLTPSAVPVPAAVWLFGSAMAGLVGYRRKSAGLAA